MADKIMSIKQMGASAFGNEIPIGVVAANVDVATSAGTKSLEALLGTNIGGGGTIESRLSSMETKLSGIDAGANKITVDSSLSSSSTNPVQNKVVYTQLTKYLPLSGGTVTGNLTVDKTVKLNDTLTTNGNISNYAEISGITGGASVLTTGCYAKTFFVVNSYKSGGGLESYFSVQALPIAQGVFDGYNNFYRYYSDGTLEVFGKIDTQYIGWDSLSKARVKTIEYTNGKIDNQIYPFVSIYSVNISMTTTDSPTSTADLGTTTSLTCGAYGITNTKMQVYFKNVNYADQSHTPYGKNLYINWHIFGRWKAT